MSVCSPLLAAATQCVLFSGMPFVSVSAGKLFKNSASGLSPDIPSLPCLAVWIGTRLFVHIVSESVLDGLTTQQGVTPWLHGSLVRILRQGSQSGASEGRETIQSRGQGSLVYMNINHNRGSE